ncbi:MAG: helix-turn-helix domain-containing protein [Polaromonas sp.]
MSNPRAGALMHFLVARMGQGNALVVSQKVLAAMMGCHERTIRRAVADLVAERYIQVVQLGHAGTVNAYVVNSAVAWGQPRDQLHLATFTATVLASADEQSAGALEYQELRRIPVLFPGERQLPTGPGEDPPSQPSMPGMEPDLPALQESDSAALERRGQTRLLP